jgi:hypothetical protein
MIRFDLPDWQRESWILAPQMQSTFHPHAQRNAFRRRDARLQTKIVCPLKSAAEPQPKLYPALQLLLIVQNRLRLRPVHFHFVLHL